MWQANTLPIAGVDEVGVGAWAGPVIAAAVVLPRELSLQGLNDSKLLSAKRRAALFDAIRQRALAIGVGRVEVAEIDRLNVYWAAMLARRRAVEALTLTPVHVLVDGKRRIMGLNLPQTPIIEGDRLHPSISAASIIAKVTCDRLMEELGAVHPGYGFERHKGYGTPEHLAALTRWGPLAVHRRSYLPVITAEGRQREFFLRPGAEKHTGRQYSRRK
ncbi:MAG: ribonuclease HII [Acetobacteraceae bacterium]|nr:ribonuclease HII [Acetobacteraceae bacterium]